MNKTRIAILGTLADLHRQPIRYDLGELKRIVEQTLPDLLGVEIERDEFERNDLANAPLEVRDALIPLAQTSDIVIVPLGAAATDELRAPRHGWLLWMRRRLIGWLDGMMTWIQKMANSAHEVNSAIVSHTCGFICHLEAYASGGQGRRAWETTNEKILRNIEWMAQRDPNTRILVAVQCRRKHALEQKLEHMPNLDLVNYWEL